jgi:predicted transcriptional regulator
MRIDENDHTVERLTKDLNGRENYFLTLASVLEDVGWIEQESSGEYIITDKGNSSEKVLIR